MTLPNHCCGARCRHCDAWRVLESNARWCARCRATTYHDERGGCLGCQEQKQ
jgi:hypothetical protein